MWVLQKTSLFCCMGELPEAVQSFSDETHAVGIVGGAGVCCTASDESLSDKQLVQVFAGAAKKDEVTKRLTDVPLGA